MHTGLKTITLAAALAAGTLIGAAPAYAQVPAFLPTTEQVAPGQATDADGTYMVSTINKRITIENGRAYVVDPWTHALVLRVKRGMVTLKNFRQTGPNTFEADDLPMMGKVIFTRQPNGTLQGVVTGAFGEAKYALVPTAAAGLPEIGAPPEVIDPVPVVEKPRVYQVHVRRGNCAGTSLLRKRYRGVVAISVVDRNDEEVLSKNRNFAVKCTKKGPRDQSYAFYDQGPGALTITVPPGQDGFSQLRVRGAIYDALGVVPFNNDKSKLIQKARDLGRDLNVNETVSDTLEIVGGKAKLTFNIAMKRTQ